MEKQLRLWTPRHPSKGLEARIFAAAAADAAPEVMAVPLRLNWLAPAMAAVLLMCVLFNQHFGSSPYGGSGSGSMAAMILSNQSAAAYLPGSFQGDRNTIPADAFDWTNVRSGVAGSPRSRTNY